MKRKVRCIIALLVVMSLIYAQQYSVSYAEEVAANTQNSGQEEMNGKERKMEAQDRDNDDDVQTDKTEKGTEQKESDKEQEAGTGTGRGATGQGETDGDVLSESENEKSGDESESGDKKEESGSESESGDKKEESGNEGETGPGKEESGGTGETPGEEKPEEKPILEYEITIPKANGEHGYYSKKPEIKIRHVSERGKTKYRLKHGDKKIAEGSLEKQDEEAILESKEFTEGKHVLHVWMEDDEGNKLEKYELKQEFLIDTKEPEISMTVPRGFDAWYQDSVKLSVDCKDSGSKIEKVSCKVDGKSIGSIESGKGTFAISKSSMSGKGVEVSVIAKDRAGNQNEHVKTVFIDNTAPKVSISRASNYAITGESVHLTCQVNEENILQEYYSEIEWENPKGKKKILNVPEWESTENGKMLHQKLSKDGIYRIKVHAIDKAGCKSSQEMQVIVDKTNPVIRYVENLDGKFIKSFSWNYAPDQMIWDFTTYQYEMRLDGKLYHMNRKITSEGKHRLTVKAKDAAGNKAKVEADFVIDHTAPEILITGVEDGQEYEEKQAFRIQLAKTGDHIKKIQINGNNQAISSMKKVYEYTLQEHGNYEVIVEAEDKAGNLAEEKVYFSIVPKETLAKKITNPVERFFEKNASNDKDVNKEADSGNDAGRKAEGQNDSEARKQENMKRIAGIGAAGILVIIGSAGIYRLRKKEE